jgi:hypothetical protein
LYFMHLFLLNKELLNREFRGKSSAKQNI